MPPSPRPDLLALARRRRDLNAAAEQERALGRFSHSHSLGDEKMRIEEIRHFEGATGTVSATHSQTDHTSIIERHGSNEAAAEQRFSHSHSLGDEKMRMAEDSRFPSGASESVRFYETPGFLTLSPHSHGLERDEKPAAPQPSPDAPIEPMERAAITGEPALPPPGTIERDHFEAKQRKAVAGLLRCADVTLWMEGEGP